MVRDNNTKQNSTHKISAVILTLLVVTLAVIVFLYRDRFVPSSLSEDSEDLADMVSSNQPFTYETGSKQMFALMGSKLAVASSTGLQLLDEDGETISREVFSMTNPAVCTSESTCAFYDVGGYSLRIYKDGEFKNMDRETAVTSVSVNSSGWYAVAGFDPGYKGSVEIYDAALKPVYEWYSGSGYIIDAAVSPDCTMLAVLCVESSGSVVHIFKMNDEDEYASVSIPDELAFKLSFEEGGNFCVISENSIHFYSTSGNELSNYSFGDDYLADYELNEKCWAVVLSKYVSGSDVTLLSFGSSGKQEGSSPLPSEPTALASQGGKLLVLCSSDISLYSRDLRLQKQNHVVPGFISAVLLPRDSVILLSSHYGEKCEFR
ncbi:MAG: DUF5711 family protein [Oscillospiraceae bacterium]|nr:DUF5711 family protein [Oscillospiraceae bacterium]